MISTQYFDHSAAAGQVAEAEVRVRQLLSTREGATKKAGVMPAFFSLLRAGTGVRPVAPQKSSAPKINDLGFIRISGIGASSRLKFLGQHCTLRYHGTSRGVPHLICRPRPESGYPLARRPGY